MTALFRCFCGARAEVTPEATPEELAEFDRLVVTHWAEGK